MGIFVVECERVEYGWVTRCTKAGLSAVAYVHDEAERKLARLIRLSVRN